MRLRQAVRSIGTTKGRPIFARWLEFGGCGPLTFEPTPYLVGWDRWSDGADRVYRLGQAWPRTWRRG